MTTLYLRDGAARVGARQLLGQGGEAEVYDLGDGTVLKLWKAADHTDFAGDAAAQAQAKARLAEQQHKLLAFPAGLPPQVVAPLEPAFADKARRVLAGYRMRKVTGVPMHHLGEVRWRREHTLTAADALAPFAELAQTLAVLHQRGVVVGDCNDLNVLVEGVRVHLIDADSYQYGPYACAMFSERFLDPRLCTSGALVPTAPHDADSDWFAFHVMLTRALLQVGPWGGSYQPRDPAQRCTAAQRVLRRLSIFEPEVVLPRAAPPLAALPDDVLAHLRAVFSGAHRGPPPPDLLRRLPFVRCASCGLEHARRRCPTCAVARAPQAHHGGLRVARLPLVELTPGSLQVPRLAAAAAAEPRGPALWLDGEALWRRTALGRERVGGVLGGQTWAFASATFGAGLYRAGAYAVALVFDPRRGGLDDRLRLPALPGEVVAVHGQVAAERAWLWLEVARAGKLVTELVVLGVGGALLAQRSFERDSAPSYLAGIPGACAIGPYLFVPTDAGIVRLELDGGEPVTTRTFPETAPWVCAGDRLTPGPGGLDVTRRDGAYRLFLS